MTASGIEWSLTLILCIQISSMESLVLTALTYRIFFCLQTHFSEGDSSLKLSSRPLTKSIASIYIYQSNLIQLFLCKGMIATTDQLAEDVLIPCTFPISWIQKCVYEVIWQEMSQNHCSPHRFELLLYKLAHKFDDILGTSIQGQL